MSKIFVLNYDEAALKEGSIVNLGSISGKVGSQHLSAYSASKAAVEAFSKSTAKELAE